MLWPACLRYWLVWPVEVMGEGKLREQWGTSLSTQGFTIHTGSICSSPSVSPKISYGEIPCFTMKCIFSTRSWTVSNDSVRQAHAPRIAVGGCFTLLMLTWVIRNLGWFLQMCWVGVSLSVAHGEASRFHVRSAPWILPQRSLRRISFLKPRDGLTVQVPPPNSNSH